MLLWGWCMPLCSLLGIPVILSLQSVDHRSPGNICASLHCLVETLSSFGFEVSQEGMDNLLYVAFLDHVRIQMVFLGLSLGQRSPNVQT